MRATCFECSGAGVIDVPHEAFRPDDPGVHQEDCPVCKNEAPCLTCGLPGESEPHTDPVALGYRFDNPTFHEYAPGSSR